MLLTEKCNSNSEVLIDLSTEMYGLAENYLKKRLIELAHVPVLVHEGSFSEIETMGHKLKGNAALFGLDELGEQGGELERLAIEGNSEEILSLSKKMLLFLNRVRFVLCD
jgi:HPt (histidine-containing phosphotransfer) domain-containing protein